MRWFERVYWPISTRNISSGSSWKRSSTCTRQTCCTETLSHPMSCWTLTATSRCATSACAGQWLRRPGRLPSSPTTWPPGGTEHQVTKGLKKYVWTESWSQFFYKKEILLGSTLYTRGVDMWAVGAILGEVRIMFLPQISIPSFSSKI